MVKAANGEPKRQRRNHRKAKVVTETLVPDGNDVTSYLTNDTKVKISVSPKEIWNKHLEDSSVIENFITNTTRVEETAVCLDMEKHLETSNFVEKIKAYMITSSREHGSEGSLSSSDNSDRLKSSCKRDHLSNSTNQEPINSKNGVNIVIPLKGKKKQTCCIKPQAYDDALDITEHHTHRKNEGDLGNSTESSCTSFTKHKAPVHILKKNKISVRKQDLFDVSSPTVLPQTKQLAKNTPSKNGNVNTDSDITNRCDQPKIFESRSSSDSILNMKPRSVLRKKESRARGKNGYESLMMATYNNIEPITGVKNKTGYISSESASSIAPAATAVRHNFKKIRLKRSKFDSAVENPVVEDPVQNIQPNVNDPCSSRQQCKDSSEELDVLEGPASAKIVGKINKEGLGLQHNLFESVVGNEESVQQNVEEQRTDITLGKNYTRNTFAANVSADIDDLKAAVHPEIFGKINNKHLQHNLFELDVGSDDENVEEQNSDSDIAMTENCAQNTLAANTKESTDISTAQKFEMKVFNKEKCGSLPPQTFRLSQKQGCSHNSQSIEDRRRMNEGELNSSANKLVERKFLPIGTGTSVYNSPILPEFGRSTDSPGDSLTISKFRPKITSSKIYLSKDGIVEQYPRTSAAVQKKVASNTFNLTHNKQHIGQSNNPTDCQPKSTDESDETNHKKRKKCDSMCDNSPPSSDLTFEPDNVPHSTMVQTSSKKKHPPPAMHKIGSKTKRSLLNSFQGLPEVSVESGKKVSVGTENAAVRITSNSRESENELADETERNDNGTRITLNENDSNTVEVNFAKKIYVPENLYAMSDHEPFAGNSSTNILKALNLRSRHPSTSDNDVSQVLSRASRKTKSLAKSSSLNSQKEFINADSKNEKKQQGNSKNVSDKRINSPENIVCGEIINPPSMGGNTKCSVSLPCMGKVSSDSISKTHENSHRNAEIKQMSVLDALAQEMCSLEAEEFNSRKSDRVSLRAERSKSSRYSFAAVSHNKQSERDVLTGRKNSNLKSSSKATGTSTENTSYYAEAPNFRKELSIRKETPELRGLASLSPSASPLNKTSRKETSLNFKNNSKESIRLSNKNSAVSNVTNDKITYSDSPDLCNANNDKRVDDYSKEGFYSVRQIENERESHMDTQPHLTEADDADDAPGENSVHSGEVRELSPPLLSASRGNTSSYKENFSPNFENSSAMIIKEISKNLGIRKLSDAKLTHSDSSGVTNANNDKRPYLKDSLHRSRQTGNRRQSNTDNQPQLIEDNDGAEGERLAITSQPPKGSIPTTNQKKVNIKQTQAKQTARACFLIDGKPYKKPKLVRPKRWINQRFYNYVLPKFDKKYGLRGTVKCEQFVELLCKAVTACISNRKNWDSHVDKVREILHEHLSINNYADFLIFADRYLPDEFVLKVGLTYEKRCEK